MEFRVSVSNEELARCLGQIKFWQAKKRLAIEDVMRKGTRAIHREARHRVPVRSGALRRSLKQGFSTVRLEGRVYSNLPYAHLVEFGSRAHTVVPKKKKALRFMVGGRTVFAKKSRIPKREPKPFLKNAYDYEEPHIIENIKKVMSDP